MIGEAFRDALRTGTTVYGTLITSTAPRLFDVTIGLGLDYVFLCNEHILYNPETLGWMCRAYRAAGINPVVRILEPSPFLATQALDAGAGAVLVPYAEDVEDVRALVGATKYRPLKGRKLERILHGEETPSPELARYLKAYNRNHALLINIESPRGVDNLDAFLALRSLDGSGVDGVVIGPHDLSTSYDLPEDFRSREFIDLCAGILRKLRLAGVAAGGHSGSLNSLDLQVEWVRAGANIILHSSDMFLFADRLQDDLKAIRAATGK